MFRCPRYCSAKKLQKNVHIIQLLVYSCKFINCIQIARRLLKKTEVIWGSGNGILGGLGKDEYIYLSLYTLCSIWTFFFLTIRMLKCFNKHKKLNVLNFKRKKGWGVNTMVWIDHCSTVWIPEPSSRLNVSFVGSSIPLTWRKRFVFWDPKEQS